MVDPAGLDYSVAAMSRRAGQLGPSNKVESQRITSTLMRSGEDRNIFGWPKPVGNQAAIAQWQALNKIRFQLHASACYCSMFDECWITLFDGDIPKPVQSCVSTAPSRDRPPA